MPNKKLVFFIFRSSLNKNLIENGIVRHVNERVVRTRCNAPCRSQGEHTDRWSRVAGRDCFLFHAVYAVIFITFYA